MKQKIGLVFFLLLGLMMIALAVFAGAVGLDHGTSWGKGRLVIFTIGGLVTLGSLLSYFLPNRVEPARSRIGTSIESLPVTAWIRSNPDIAYLSKLCHGSFFTLPVALLVIAAYFWFFTANLWLYRLPGNSGYYYELQAQAFRNGQLSIQIQPSPELLALPDPYDPQERQTRLTAQTDAPLDFSLYQGKYYEYWGPVPALVVITSRPFYHGQYHNQVSDLELIFGFLCALFLSEYLLALILWERFFQSLPKGVLLLSILLAGLVYPSAGMLTRSIAGVTVMVYQAAILAGQFFLISGLLAALSAIDRDAPSGWRLALAGSLWTMAVGSRNILVLPVGFFTLMIAYRIYRARSGQWAGLIRQMVPLGLPLACGALGLVWYNWARFGSIGETGVSYLLAGPYDLRKYLGELFSPIYALQNIYNYLLMPFQLQTHFPYLIAIRGMVHPVFSFYQLPAGYATNPLAGLLFSAPFCVFALVPAIRLVARPRQGAADGNVGATDNRELFFWVVVCLTGGFLATFVVLQVFLWAAMRYIEDFMPALILLSLIGFWQGLSLLGTRSISGRLYFSLGVILAIISIITGIFGTVGNDAHTWLANPLLTGWFTAFFAHP